jgi:hypothetical protein
VPVIRGGLRGFREVVRVVVIDAVPPEMGPLRLKFPDWSTVPVTGMSVSPATHGEKRERARARRTPEMF